MCTKAFHPSTTEIIFAHTSPSCRDLSTGRTAAPRRFSRLDRVADRLARRSVRTTLVSRQNSMNTHLCQFTATRTLLSNPFTVEIIISNLGEKWRLREGAKIDGLNIFLSPLFVTLVTFLFLSLSLSFR